MKLKINFILMTVVLFMASCSSNSNSDPIVNLAQDIAGNYEGYSTAKFKYSDKPMITPNEKISLKANADGTLNISFKSNKWGAFSISNAKVSVEKTQYSVKGHGTTLMGMDVDSQKEYESTVEGSVDSNKESLTLVFNVPAVMGGVELTFTLGEAPVQDLISGVYEGTLEYGIAKGEKSKDENSMLTIKKQDNGKYTITLQSFGEGMMKLGDTVIKDFEIKMAEDGSYTFDDKYTGTSGKLNTEGSLKGKIGKDTKIKVVFEIKAGKMPFALEAIFTSK